jgi:hypothetical protein
MVLFSDTDADAHAAQMGVYRRIGPAGRVRLAMRMSDEARELALEGIRRRHPDYVNDELHTALLVMFLGEELVQQAWPERKMVRP